MEGTKDIVRFPLKLESDFNQDLNLAVTLSASKSKHDYIMNILRTKVSEDLKLKGIKG